ncbi:cyclopropane fatty acyl phospholipid synthase [Pasteurellaceae bacterium USgator11]|nr:cyclopropane fatty acyl phospholipid synthase [Pasteurellaceae bacterium USgator41]TNG96991.1 cyclopropane fatty acyl phospholipid synthase [Pasteurellaceae bacterium UScroc31]TNG97344.1 cyclopropane fatty acyl phospholipid synthase [Pasteurellaceae bacterium UScroc12]TNG99627.1 cyclopropane fatty acyl phospholipid synthase [Pasteurellaceae bacterium USgator11]
MGSLLIQPTDKEVKMKPHDRSKQIVNRILEHAGITVNGSRPYDIQIENPKTYARVIQFGSLGLGESYMDGWWHCKRLDQFFYQLLRNNADRILPANIPDLIHALLMRSTNMQSRRRAWIVGREHYDLGNELFEQMLDSNMQYSCGYWANAADLEQAQVAKLRMICDKLGLKAGMTLLDIGCGWGGLAKYAAEHYGTKVTGITISKQQQILAQQRCQGLDVEILLQDYRDIRQQYDRVVSVGMFEHVGPKNHAEYFKVAARALKEDGIFLLHTIGSNITSNKVDGWIHKYIFPNGNLPSARQIAQAAEGHLLMEDWHNFGSDYDKTLMSWYANFCRAWPSLAADRKYDERFKRMFTYYLNCCAGAFRARDIQLWQVLFSLNGVEGGIKRYC